MSTVAPRSRRFRLGPRSAGLTLTTAEFDRARFRKGWRYELINGVLVVSPIPSRQVRGPAEYLGYWLRIYQEQHPQGSCLDATLYAETIETKQNRRRSDRAIWIGLGRLPDEGEPPAIVVEFVSSGTLNQDRDFIIRWAEYREVGVREFWVIDRFRRTLTVHALNDLGDQEHVIKESETYATPLLPGFELPLGRLLEIADRAARKKKPP